MYCIHICICISKDKDKCKTKHVGLAKEVYKPEMVIIFQSNQRSQISYILLICIAKAAKWVIALVKGALAHGVSNFPKYFVFASLCSFICLQAVYQLSGPED